MSNDYIPESTVTEIQSTADLISVAMEILPDLKKKGKDYVANCPLCLAPNKLHITPTKRIFKCFNAGCDCHGVGAVTFLMVTQGYDYTTSLRYIAKKYSIVIPTAGEKAKTNKKKTTFRDLQLLESGIANGDQKWHHIVDKNKTIERDRYEAMSLDNYGKPIPGDDMILNYVGLDGQPLEWRDKQNRIHHLVRVRHQYPHNHLDRNGKPMKYRSPLGSPNAVWLPQALIKAYTKGTSFDTLVITEGEKKADKSCLSGTMTVGIMGIHNLNYEGMAHIFEQIMKKCQVKNVIFLVDSDWKDIGSGDNVDYRPLSFYNALLRFRDYFYGYKNSGIDLNIFFSYGLDIAFKGIDDLLVRGLKGQESKLNEDISKAIIDREGKGEYVNCHNVTTMSQHKMREFWGLHNTKEFINLHINELKKRSEFKVKGLRYRFNDDGEPEMIEKILPDEQYWNENTVETRYGPKTELQFNYYQSLKFLASRGFGLYEFTNGQYRFVRQQGKILKETTPHKIQQYVKDFTEEIQRIDVLNMILRGGTQYLGPNQLSNLWYVKPDFLEPRENAVALVFRNEYWHITPDKIEPRPLSDLEKVIWDNQIIQFDARYLGAPMVDVARITKSDNTETWAFKEAKNVKCQDKSTWSADDCVLYKFLLVTSDFWWRKKYTLITDEEGKQVYAELPKEKQIGLTADEFEQLKAHLVCKMIAIGYTIQPYRDLSQMKAIIAIDGQETAVNKSMGGTGKSIVATQFEHVFNTFVIDGKKPNLAEDKHVFEGVDDRTGAIIFDDVKVNFNFEWLFSKITTGVEINGKGIKAYRLPSVPIWVVTNHMLNGDDTSTRRRQYHIAFSDFFNDYRTPRDYFGHILFKQWDWNQWNLYYNFIATCIQTYLRFSDLNKYTIPNRDIEKRKLRQSIGENFLDFAEVYYAPEDITPSSFMNAEEGSRRNKAVCKNRVMEEYLRQYPADRKFYNTRTIKDKVQLYCRYKGLDFNPNADGSGRVKSGQIEYLIVADQYFDAQNYSKLI